MIVQIQHITSRIVEQTCLNTFCFFVKSLSHKKNVFLRERFDVPQAIFDPRGGYAVSQSFVGNEVLSTQLTQQRVSVVEVIDVLKEGICVVESHDAVHMLEGE